MANLCHTSQMGIQPEIKITLCYIPVQMTSAENIDMQSKLKLDDIIRCKKKRRYFVKHFPENLTTCQQDVFATGLWQACQQVVTMLQVATRLSLTTC